MRSRFTSGAKMYKPIMFGTAMTNTIASEKSSTAESFIMQPRQTKKQKMILKISSETALSPKI